MKNVIRSVSGLAACVVGIFLATNPVAMAGFDLSFDGFRKVGSSSYEIDVVMTPNLAFAHPDTIEMLTYNLTITPANGYSVGAITGVRFDGFRNPSPLQSLFGSVDPIPPVISTLRMEGAIISSAGPVSAPTSGSKLAFTVLFSTNNSNPSDVQINFSNPDNPNQNAFLEAFENDASTLQPFNGLASSQALTIFSVPEPNLCALVSLGMIGLARCRRRRRSGSC